MAIGPTDGGDGHAESPATSHVPADEGAPTEALVSGTVGDRCVNCGAPLSSDQRYCVVCGERRGQPRFALPEATRAAEEPAAPAPRREPRRPRVSSGATLVAGVGTLLLAMGVGVLIGHSTSSNAKTVAGAPPQVITVNGGGGSSSGSSSGTGSGKSGSGAAKTPSKSSSKTHHTAKATTKTAPKAAKKTVAKQQAAASKVLGGSAKNVPPATVTVGAKGKGAGYNKKTGKFDGSFFGQ